MKGIKHSNTVLCLNRKAHFMRHETVTGILHGIPIMLGQSHALRAYRGRGVLDFSAGCSRVVNFKIFRVHQTDA